MKEEKESEFDRQVMVLKVLGVIAACFAVVAAFLSLIEPSRVVFYTSTILGTLSLLLAWFTAYGVIAPVQADQGFEASAEELVGAFSVWKNAWTVFWFSLTAFFANVFIAIAGEGITSNVRQGVTFAIVFAGLIVPVLSFTAKEVTGHSSLLTAILPSGFRYTVLMCTLADPCMVIASNSGSIRVFKLGSRNPKELSLEVIWEGSADDGRYFVTVREAATRKLLIRSSM